jgi:hypothetical protein
VAETSFGRANEEEGEAGGRKIGSICRSAVAMFGEASEFGCQRRKRCVYESRVVLLLSTNSQVFFLKKNITMELSRRRARSEGWQWPHPEPDNFWLLDEHAHLEKTPAASPELLSFKLRSLACCSSQRRQKSIQQIDHPAPSFYFLGISQVLAANRDKLGTGAGGNGGATGGEEEEEGAKQKKRPLRRPYEAYIYLPS